MKFKRILLVKPTYAKSHYRGVGLTSGLGYISEALSRAQIENTVIDMQLGYTLENLFSKIKSIGPDLIGISLMTFAFRTNYELINNIKRAFSCVKIAAGGPHVSTMREKVLEDCQSIDFGVTMEGEETLVELCRGRTLMV